MNQLHHILAATDLSAPARHAAERAAVVSRETGAKLDLVHVANLSSLERLWHLMDTTGDEVQRKVLGAARLRMEVLVASLHQRYGVEPRIQVSSGNLLEELTEQTEKSQAELLVCGAQGESVIRHMLLGTTALRILSTASCPVLVVKQPPHAPYQRLLLPVDFSPASLRAIVHARSVAPQAELVLLHVFDIPFEGQMRYASVDEDVINRYRIASKQEAIQQLHALREEAQVKVATCSLVVQQGDPALRIVDLAREQDCDLIVMGKHGQNMLEKILLGSVTKHVLNQCQGDLLVSM